MAPFPLLVVSDLENATRWYQKTLGFRLLFEMPGPEGWPVLAHLRWPEDGHLLLVGDGRTLPLRDPSVPGITLTFPLSKGSVDEFAETASAHGADILVGPLDQPWHSREVTLKDPDGYRLTFVQT